MDVSRYFVPSNQIQGFVSNLIMHLSGLAKNPEIEKILSEKNTAKMVSEWFIKPHRSNKANYCKISNRICIESYIEETLKKYDIKKSADYQNFCMEIYAAIRNRKIKCPDGIKSSKFFKTSAAAFNQQYDFYHLCYSKYVRTFVTDDLVLQWLANKFKEYGIIECAIMNSDNFYNSQIRDLLSGKLRA